MNICDLGADLVTLAQASWSKRNQFRRILCFVFQAQCLPGLYGDHDYANTFEHLGSNPNSSDAEMTEKRSVTESVEELQPLAFQALSSHPQF